MSERGLLIVLSGPSGVGKGTVRKAIFDSEENDFQYSISMTTRKQREGEVDGVDYYFRSREEFEAMIEAGEMLEYAEYVGNYYGTPLTYVNQTLDEGKDVFLEIEVQGLNKSKTKCLMAYLSFDTSRFSGIKIKNYWRGTDEMSVIEERMAVAREEIEMMALYDYAVVNDEVPLAVQRIKDIIASEHFRVDRVIGKYIKMLEEM